MSAEELVHYDVRDGVATITLDSPHNRNAISTPLVDQLVDRLARAESDDGVRVLVLTHAGRTFCAGADLSEASGTASPLARTQRLADLLRSMITLGKPIIAKVDGHVRAGGMGLVAACDIVMAGPEATFGLTESRIGVAASVVSLVVLPRLPASAASRYLLTGDTFDAATAQAIGFATETAPTAEEADGALGRLLDSFRVCSPQGLRESKILVNHDLVAGFDAGRARVVEQSSRLFASDEAREGMTAFLEKRKPRWARPSTEAP